MVIKFFKHLHLVNKHRFYVCRNCFIAGQYKRGLLHDLSKYSPTEFFESVKYYQGDRSPIDACKEINGWSKAWIHHKGRNRHHWEYWIDNINNGYPEAILMPYEFAVEMLCDYIGAGQAYEKHWTPQSQYAWWHKKKTNVFMHPVIENFINTLLEEMANNDIRSQQECLQIPYKTYLTSKHLKYVYDLSCNKYGDLSNHYRKENF